MGHHPEPGGFASCPWRVPCKEVVFAVSNVTGALGTDGGGGTMLVNTIQKTTGIDWELLPAACCFPLACQQCQEASSIPEEG